MFDQLSNEVEVVTIQDAEDLRENLQHSQKNYVIVRIHAGIVDEQMVKKYASDEIEQKILRVQDRA